MIEIRVYTHPACSGCARAVEWAWRVQERHPGEMELRTVSLETEEGLAEAHTEKVKTIPTIIISRDQQELERIVGSPRPEHDQWLSADWELETRQVANSGG